MRVKDFITVSLLPLPNTTTKPVVPQMLDDDDEKTNESALNSETSEDSEEQTTLDDRSVTYMATSTLSGLFDRGKSRKQ